MTTDAYDARIKLILESHPETAKELFERILQTKDWEEYGATLQVLHARGNREVFDLASRYCQSKVAAERALGARVIGQLGWEKHPFLEERFQILLRLLSDKRVSVLHAAGQSLGHMPPDLRVIAPLASLKNHKSSAVRWAVAFGLQGYNDDLAIKTLIELSEDEDEEVRDWATTGIGSLTDVDSPEIREALLRRTRDPDFDTRGEALMGLAHRKDLRVLEPLREELKRDGVGLLAIQAAEALADPSLRDVLLDLRERTPDDGDDWDVALKAAIDASGGARASSES